MRQLLFVSTLIFVCFAASLTIAGDFRSLTGRYALTTAGLVDPMPNEKPDRVVFFLEGKSAEEMYKGMSQVPTKDVCARDALSKRAGNLVCSRLDSGSFFCTFGIGLLNGHLLNGRAC